MPGTNSDRRSGYERFYGNPSQEDEPVLLPVSMPAEELQHLTGDDCQHQQPQDNASALFTVTRFLWQGGSPGDAWLHMTAAQVLTSEDAGTASTSLQHTA